jgi:hypothetical protein
MGTRGGEEINCMPDSGDNLPQAALGTALTLTIG